MPLNLFFSFQLFLTFFLTFQPFSHSQICFPFSTFLNFFNVFREKNFFFRGAGEPGRGPGSNPPGRPGRRGEKPKIGEGSGEKKWLRGAPLYNTVLQYKKFSFFFKNKCKTLENIQDLKIK